MFTKIKNLQLEWLTWWRRWRPLKTQASDPVSSIDPEKFSCLLRSGRKQDMKILAKMLSDKRGRSSRV